MARGEMTTKGRRDAAGSKAEERRHDIVNRAALLFDRKGVDQVSMTDIAEEVGLAKPSLYHYFASKDEILYSIHLNTTSGLASEPAGDVPDELARFAAMAGV